ncbi:MAG: META domain-containing protein [Dehalococcoidia bacterium]|nr:META domain-containing protein [Dehalococcoidia bacterium]
MDGGALTINPIIAATLMACEKTIMQQEMAYLAVLPTAAAWTVADDTLTLVMLLARHYWFTRPLAPPLTGTTWQVTGL